MATVIVIKESMKHYHFEVFQYLGRGRHVRAVMVL